ncbi:MAG: hypothetical protein AB1485_00625 [Candidatus Thermoplasmatota archaeon]
METKKIIEKIFNFRGYVLSDENNIIIATKENTRIAIACIEDEAHINRFDELVNTKADKKIFACNVPLDLETQAQIKSLNIILWSGEQLERELGKAVLASTEKGFLETVERKHIFLKSRLSKEDAELKVRHLGINSLTLEFSPYYLYKYTCRTFEKGYLDTKESSGSIGINGTDGSYRILKTELDEQLLAEQKPELTKKVLELSESKAFELAQQALIELNTKVIEVRDERATAVIFEKRKVAPSKESIALTLIGICYMPFWYVKGKFGNAVIDGITGEVVKEEVTQGVADEKIEVV